VIAGEEARPIGEAASAAGLKDVRFLAMAEEAADTLPGELRDGDHLLIKASRAIGLEAVVEALAVE
jgi:UDP-N-acetylmuramyl pentapeptide synthase